MSTQPTPSAMVEQLQNIVTAASEAQACLTNIILANSVVPVPSFVAGTPLTPAELAAVTPEAPPIENYWVVLRGREPGLYLTAAAANDQTKGVPSQYQRRKSGRAEALAFYAANYPDHIRKWVPLPAPVPIAESFPEPETSANASS
ncbi:hypothetical protein DFH09DRAFT_1106604 [Mycena vulgaris]|nr:hypothetical protein DFH09DRAFT_1106604 [Mycena vulgaris]